MATIDEHFESPFDRHFERFLLDMGRLKQIVEGGRLKLLPRQAKYLVNEGLIQRETDNSAFYVGTDAGKSLYDRRISSPLT